MRRLSTRQRTATIVLTVLALCFITLDLGGGALRDAHGGVRGFVGALYRGTDAVVGPVRNFVAGVPSAGSNEATIQRLQHRVNQLEGSLAAQATDASTAARLRRLQLAADRGQYRIVAAQVIAIGPGQGFDWTVTLDVGTDEHVKIDQTVTDGDGLVGRVVHADRSTCVVLLGADPGSGVGARDVRTGQVGVAGGRGTGGYVFTPLDPAAVVRVGDRLVTGPSADSTYVGGLSLGTVTAVRTAADGSMRATVRPTTSPTSLAIVGVILVGGRTTPRPAITPRTTNPPQAGHR